MRQLGLFPTALEFAETLTSWHVHRPAGRKELRRLAAAKGYTDGELFDAAVTLHDKVKPKASP